MLKFITTITLAAAGAGLVVAATPAQAATSHIALAQADWIEAPGLYGVAPAASHLTLARRQWVAANQAPAANMDHHLPLAARQLAAYGKKYAIQRGQVTRLAALPITGLTKAQLAQAYRLVHALNAFFHTHY